MRTLWFQGIIVVASAVLALTMQVINLAFEAAGSVPDIEGCGFLAGGLVVLLLLYPLVALVIGVRVARRLMRRFPEAIREVVRMSSWVGFGGAALYFGFGMVGALARPHADHLAPAACAAVALYTVIITLAARQGARWAASTIHRALAAVIERDLSGEAG